LNQSLAKCDKAIGTEWLIVESVTNTIGCNVQSVVLVTIQADSSFPSVFPVLWIGTIRAAKLGTDGSDGKFFSVAKGSEFFSQLLD
jgi:hypothetical protein